MQADIFKRYLVIVAYKTKGRFFTIHLGNFEDQGEEIVDSLVVKRIKAQNGSKFGRYMNEYLYQHMKHVVREAQAYLEKKHIKQVDGVIVGGHREHLNRIKEFLPKSLQLKLVGEFIAEPDLSIGELTYKATRSLGT